MRTTVRRLNDIGGAAAAQPALAFASDWSTGTGRSNTVRLDGKWDSGSPWNGDDTDPMEVVANPGTLGFPANLENLLLIEHRGSDSFMLHKLIWSEPGDVPVGTTVYHRFYYHSLVAGATVSKGVPHTFQPPTGVHPGAGTFAWAWRPEWDRGDGKEFQNIVQGEPTDPSRSQTTYWPAGGLSYGTTYRMEFAFHRYATNSVDLVDWRIYDESVSSTVPAWDENTIVVHPSVVSGVGTVDPDQPDYLAEWHAERGPTTISCDNNALILRKIELGNNGPSVSPPPGGSAPWYYHGAYACSIEGWIGPYILGEGV